MLFFAPINFLEGQVNLVRFTYALTREIIEINAHRKVKENFVRAELLLGLEVSYCLRMLPLFAFDFMLYIPCKFVLEACEGNCRLHSHLIRCPEAKTVSICVRQSELWMEGSTSHLLPSQLTNLNGRFSSIFIKR